MEIFKMSFFNMGLNKCFSSSKFQGFFQYYRQKKIKTYQIRKNY